MSLGSCRRCGVEVFRARFVRDAQGYLCVGCYGVERNEAAGLDGDGNAFRPMIFEEGLTWNQATVAPEDAEFLETRKFTVVEIARWFGGPPCECPECRPAPAAQFKAAESEYLFASGAGTLSDEHRAWLYNDGAGRPYASGTYTSGSTANTYSNGEMWVAS